MTIKPLYANRSINSDFVRNAIEELSRQACDVLIAVAFFTEATIVEELVGRNCRVKLVVRLGFPTSPYALQRLLKNPGVQIRFFTGHTFHPKLYLFGDQMALVGSANLTTAAVQRNQEVMVSIPSEQPLFNQLGELFSGYWDDAAVLEQRHLDEYKSLFDQFDKLDTQALSLGQRVLEKLGESEPRAITTANKKKSKQSVFLDSFRKSYQSSVNAFKALRQVYERRGYRKVPEDQIPLEIEIDSFISFVRDRYVVGDAWATTPLRYGKDQDNFIGGFIDEWSKTTWPHFEVDIVQRTYPTIRGTFKSKESISAATDEQLFDALATLHSFHDRLRFYKGGMPTWRETFGAANDPKAIRETLAYLIFGTGKVEERMANVIFDPDYKPDLFGRANVQELVGWCGIDELPIINGRTTKILRYFGTEVHQL